LQASFPPPQGAVISQSEPTLDEQADLRGGTSPWFNLLPPTARAPLTQDLRCDVLIVGCGITGALMAERLTRQGLDVILIDRELPGRGSTAASTAMLLWEIDRSLSTLTDVYGFERAARAYRASFDAMRGLTALVRDLDLRCELRMKPSLYLAAGETATSLITEHELRRRAGLPGDYLDHRALLSTFDITRAGALLSPGSADADPVLLTAGLLAVIKARGARLFEAEAETFDSASGSVGVGMADGRTIEATSVVLATGYARPDIIASSVQDTASSWVIATVPQPDRLWRDDALIWEDSESYLYARTTIAGRIIIGGEDSNKIVAPDARDALIPAKAERLQHRLRALWPRARTEIDFAWAGTFDTTADGLPLIGPVPGHRNMYAAYGYGGNGITFSFMAAQLIGGLLAGETSPLIADFAIDRDPPPSLA
jgi:glycine/D-amino acid oxidase-like deaminating enzyme